LVQIGQPAFVKLDSMPDQRFQGVVEKVALLPDSQSRFGNPNLKVYNTEVVITDPLPGVKPGVSAQAEIVITNISNSLSVPLQAVTTYKGRQVVYAQQGAKSQPVPVQVGMFNTKFIEILAGIKEGDRVLLSPPFDTQERDLEGAVLSADEKAKAATNGAARRMAGDKPPGTARPVQSPVPGVPAGGADLATSRGAAEPGPEQSGLSGDQLKRFDKDGDGQLSQSEQDTMRLAMAGAPGGPGGPPGFNREEMVKQFDKNGDGQLDDTEREAMRTAMQARMGGRGQGGPRLSPEEMLKRFDKNGDGQLDEQERAAMRESLGARGERGGRSPRGEGRPSEGGPSPVGPGAPVRSD
jgi:hypothetical protein